MSGTMHPARFDALHAWARNEKARDEQSAQAPHSARGSSNVLACPACAALAPRMRANTREWIDNIAVSVVGRRFARASVVRFATTVAGFVAGVAVESAVKHICAGSSHAKRESNRLANWRRAIVTR
jgi:hypothetical protein